jgi:hypothetical protein
VRPPGVEDGINSDPDPPDPVPVPVPVPDPPDPEPDPPGEEGGGGPTEDDGGGGTNSTSRYPKAYPPTVAAPSGSGHSAMTSYLPAGVFEGTLNVVVKPPAGPSSGTVTSTALLG